jgi:hypothetical protein
MPPQFVVPELILEVERRGLARTFQEIHSNGVVVPSRRETEPPPDLGLIAGTSESDAGAAATDGRRHTSPPEVGK